MAKQTFTTGQILTAAQMTSLQETAMGGGAATAKTTSYVLTAADAGTTVAMNSSGATTITVNTGLFAAGDTVFIQNLGTGVCTITAGTATVNSAGSLALPQYDGGILYFTSASAAIFYDYIQAGMTSPLTTKGDLWSYTTTDARLASSGVNGDVLTVDTSTATGLKWASSTSALSYTLLNAGGTTLSGSTTTISSLSGYDFLYVYIVGGSTSTTSSIIEVRLNTDTNTNYYQSGANAYYNTNTTPMLNGGSDGATKFGLARMGNNATNTINGVVTIIAANSTGVKQVNIWGAATGSTTPNGFLISGHYAGSSVISSISIITSDTFDAGTVYVYGAN